MYISFDARTPPIYYLPISQCGINEGIAKHNATPASAVAKVHIIWYTAYLELPVRQGLPSSYILDMLGNTWAI